MPLGGQGATTARLLLHHLCAALRPYANRLRCLMQKTQPAGRKPAAASAALQLGLGLEGGNIAEADQINPP
jgi:hypothetical protein